MANPNRAKRRATTAVAVPGFGAIQGIRHFDGVPFGFNVAAKTKTRAMEKAADSRSVGLLARVAKVEGGYAVYVSGLRKG